LLLRQKFRILWKHLGNYIVRNKIIPPYSKGSMPPPSPRRQVRGISRNTQLHMHVFLLKHLGLGVGEISKQLCLDQAWVSQVLLTDIAREILANLARETIEKTIDIQVELSKMLCEHLDVPRQILSGRVKQIVSTNDPITGEQGVEEIEVGVSPELRLRAFTDIGRLAGLGVAKTVNDNRTMYVDRLIQIKERARAQGLLAESPEDET